jgi:hypothetical protein
VGFEPTDGGFADLSLRPLGYRAGVKKYSETGIHLSVAAPIEKILKLREGQSFFRDPSAAANAGDNLSLDGENYIAGPCVGLARRHGHDLRFADETGGFLGRRGTDVESGTPLEARDFGELGNDLDMPVVMFAGFLADG